LYAFYTTFQETDFTANGHSFCVAIIATNCRTLAAAYISTLGAAILGPIGTTEWQTID
jgi:hypothetical protein